MNMLPRYARPIAFVLVALLAGSWPARAADETLPPCTEDAMIVFDASGSMAGNMVQGLFSAVTRIDEVRKALGEVLPSATKFRKVGLITYGPGPYAQCNVELNFPPIPNAAQRIMSVVNTLNPAGKTSSAGARCRSRTRCSASAWSIATTLACLPRISMNVPAAGPPSRSTIGTNGSGGCAL
jgi:hypothetical protein